MYRLEKEIDQYEFKAKNILNNLDKSATDKEIEELALETGLDTEEISTIIHYLNRSQYIEINRENHISISSYGRMINNGEINVGYAPL